MLKGFSVQYRNPGHWDIYQSGVRIFKIRGAPGEVALIIDPDKRGGAVNQYFNTVDAAMSRVVNDLMFEHIVAEGDQPTVIEGWNRSAR